MKKVLVSMAICACLSISCNKEVSDLRNDEMQLNVSMQTVTITASMAETKTSYTIDPSDDSKLVFSWTKGDQISVKCTDGAFYTFTANSSGATTTFTGEIPSGYALDSKAYFPADAGHTSDSFNLPYYKDITGHDSADIPMVGTKGDKDAYSFAHCAGAALITIENIPEEVTAVTIKVASSHSSNPSYNYKLSGLFYISSGPRWSGAYATAETNENIYSRKVVVSNHTAKMYLPCPAGADNWVPNKLTVTGHTSEGDVALFTDKAMKALGTIARAHVTPLTPLVYSQLGKINWAEVDMYPDTADEAFPGNGDRIINWKVMSDSRYIYTYIKYNKADAASAGSSHYLYVGFDTDNDPASGGDTAYLSKVEAITMVYPIKSYSEGVFTFDPSNSNNYIQSPVGTPTGKPSHLGSADASYVYAEIAVDRSLIGCSASGKTIGIKVAVRSQSSTEQTITLL